MHFVLGRTQDYRMRIPTDHAYDSPHRVYRWTACAFGLITAMSPLAQANVGVQIQRSRIDTTQFVADSAMQAATEVERQEHPDTARTHIKVFAAVQPTPPRPAAKTLADIPASTIPEPAAIKGSSYRLVDNWDFGATINSQSQVYSQFHSRFVWENGKLDTLPSNGEWQRFRDRDNVRIEGTNLKLIAYVRNGLNKTGGIESGMIRSKTSYKYGYFEARIKVPDGRGLWPAFWLVPDDGRWPPEIDVVEIINNGESDTRTSYHNLHPGKADASDTVNSKLDKWGGYRPGSDYKSAYHVFAVEWTSDKVKHFVDDVLVAERHFHWKYDDGSDAGKAQVLFTLAVGGTWPGPPLNLSDFPAAVEIDYIRVWQR
jgi:beta-glucanase (GH16 family)